MKQLLFATLFVFVGFFSHGQDRFEWDEVTDSVDANKSQLFSKTKLFIAETWKSAQHVVQLEDRESGVILIKGSNIQEFSFRWFDRTWIFGYTVKFMVKDNKARIMLYDVHCDKSYAGSHEWPPLPISETYPKKTRKELNRLNKDDYLALMRILKEELDAVVHAYIAAVQEPFVENDSDW